MIRPRKGGNKDLPANLYFHKHSKQFEYRNPISKDRFYFGKNKQIAIEAAIELNAKLMPGDSDYVADVMGLSMTIDKWCDIFENQIMTKMKLADETKKGYRRQLAMIKKHFKSKRMAEISVLEVASFLDSLPGVLSKRVRSLLILLFKYAISKGHCDINVAEQTIPEKTEKERQRLSLELFNSILNYSEKAKDDNGNDIELTTPAWLKNSMMLGLFTLQRIGDISRMKFDDIKDGYLYVIQEKTKKHGIAARLKIKVTPELDKIIKACRDEVVSPFLIHRKPIRNIMGESKVHPTQCTRDYISRSFCEVRNKVIDKKIPAKERPTFHEIRSLGASLYEKAGIDPQSLLGHTTKKMTDEYLEGHDKWTEVKVAKII